jgi:hypothetical protein
MAHRKAAIQPFITTADWEKTMSAHGLPVNQRTTSLCLTSTLAQAVTVRPDQVEPILSGRQNVLFISNDVPRCFSTQSKVFLVVDEAIDAKSAYTIPASVTIENFIERINSKPQARSSVGHAPLERRRPHRSVWRH